MRSPWPVSDSSWEADVSGHPGATVVAFVGASSVASQAFAKVLNAVLTASADSVRVLCLDVEAHPLSARRYDISVLPTVLVFRDGTLRHRLVGTRSPERLWHEVAPHLA